MYRSALLFAVCFCCLFLLASVQAQGRQEKVPSEELKAWINQLPVANFVKEKGLQIAERDNVSAEQVVKELIEYVQSQGLLRAESKQKIVASLEWAIRPTLNSGDPKLYGKTLDGKDFDWEALRGKYVLVKFTATWCPSCVAEIPSMLESYKKYHDKEFEIVSVHIRERGTKTNQVAAVKKFVHEKKLPWIIISETLTVNAGQPGQQEFYVTKGVPTMVLVDKEGKIIMTQARAGALQTKLAEIFE